MPEIETECLAFAEDLSALLDEELDAQREAEVRTHVDACAACAERLQDLCNADLVLAGLPAAQPSADLRERLDARLAAGQVTTSDARAPRPLRRAPARRRRRGLALGIAGGLAAAAAVVLALLFGVPRDAAEPGVPIARETPPEPVLPEPPSEIAVEEPAAGRPLAPEVATPDAQLAALDALPDEDAALLLDLDTVAELDLMANLDLLEAMVDLGLKDGV